MTELQVFSRIEREYQLFTLPEVLAQVLKATEDRNSSLEAIARIISRDVALTGKLLKMANSSFYGRAANVGSVREAIGILGTRTVKAIALSVSVYDLCGRLEGRLDIKDFWRHSLEVAIVAELIAKKIKSQSAEEAFVCGLLHDIGVLILDSTYPKEYEQVWHTARKGEDLTKTEETYVDVDHTKVGAFVAEQWNLPKRYIGAIRGHHDEFHLSESLDSQERLTQIVSLASRMSSYSLNASSYTSRKNLENKRALVRNLGLSEDDLADVQSQSVKQIIETAQFLEIDVGSPLDLVQRANDLLFQLICQIEVLYDRMDDARDHFPQNKIDEIATDVMHTVVATFSHYFNNACATILGRSQLLEMAIDKQELVDNGDKVLSHSIEVMQRGVESITNVLNVMKSVESFQTVEYHESAKIIDLKEQLDALTADQLEPQKQT